MLINPYIFGVSGDVVFDLDFNPNRKVPGAPEDTSHFYYFNSNNDVTSNSFTDAEIDYDAVNDVYWAKKGIASRILAQANLNYGFEEGRDTTIECWIRPPINTGSRGALLNTWGHHNSGTRVAWTMFKYNSTFYLSLMDSTHAQLMNSGVEANTLTSGVPVHLAMTKEGDVFRHFINGNLVGEKTVVGYSSIIKDLELGGASYGPLICDISKIKITSNKSNYDKAYSPSL